MAKGAIQLYLRDIGVIPLLSREEEIKLAKRARRGDKTAKKTLVKANLRLVVSIAKHYTHLGVPFLDIIEEGNIGLIKAIEKYNPRKGVKVSTYASWWIKQAVIRALANQGKTIRIPVYLVEKSVSIDKAKQRLNQKLGRMPKPEEIAKNLKMPVAKVREILAMRQSFSSIYMAINDEGVGQLLDIIENIDAVSPSQLVSSSMLHRDMLDLLDILNEREQKIIRMRFGLSGNLPKTLQEIGKKFRISRERVRQIETNAVKKMKVFLKKQRRYFNSYWPGK